MGGLGHAHHRGGNLSQQPGQGDLRHGHASRLCQGSHLGENGGVLVRCAVVLALGVAVLFQPLGGLPRVLGQPAAGQGTIGGQGDVLLPAEGDHFPLFLPE